MMSNINSSLILNMIKTLDTLIDASKINAKALEAQNQRIISLENQMKNLNLFVAFDKCAKGDVSDLRINLSQNGER